MKNIAFSRTRCKVNNLCARTQVFQHFFFNKCNKLTYINRLCCHIAIPLFCLKQDVKVGQNNKMITNRTEIACSTEYYLYLCAYK